MISELGSWVPVRGVKQGIITFGAQPSEGHHRIGVKGQKEYFVKHYANKRLREPVVITSGERTLWCKDPKFDRSPVRDCPREGHTRGSCSPVRLPTRSSSTESCRRWDPNFKHNKQIDVPPESGMVSYLSPYSMWNDGRPDYVQHHWPQLNPPAQVPYTARPPTQVSSR